ncbi:MAG: DegT/DnrJ/EryC1/StrS family aminotransferase [Clostridia bacterium]|nr:DegT/DnrJ/EryC1/StrS family aminotransferase [Clostridia bacterium]
MARLLLSPPYIGGREEVYVREAFESNWIAPLGPQVTALEEALAARVEMPYALATASGTSALHLALKALGVGKGDRVFCSSFTFAASCNPIVYQGAEPVFIDSDPVTLNLSADALSRALADAKREGKLPRAVVVVDLYGRSADFDRILPLCREYGVPVLEDAAEALGATYHGRPCGSFGDLSVLSFNGNKIITTSGGGMVFCREESLRQKMLFWATQAKEPVLHYEHTEIGYNYRLSNVCAAIGRGQLEILDEKLSRRLANHESYRALLADAPVTFAPEFDGNRENHWLSFCFLNDDVALTSEQVCLKLLEMDLETRPAWKPMHAQPVFSSCRAYSHGGGEDFVSDRLYDRGVCLPSGDLLTEDDRVRVAEALRSIIG